MFGPCHTIVLGRNTMLGHVWMLSNSAAFAICYNFHLMFCMELPCCVLVCSRQPRSIEETVGKSKRHYRNPKYEGLFGNPFKWRKQNICMEAPSHYVRKLKR
ncbi:unnamed protein product [Lathyrus sativus]|nr:unnamed protein product [Lathyrus sativus]